MHRAQGKPCLADTHLAGQTKETGRAQFIVPLRLNPNFFNAILDTQYAIRITIH